MDQNGSEQIKINEHGLKTNNKLRDTRQGIAYINIRLSIFW